MSTQIRATSNVYTHQLTGNLGLLLEVLNCSLENCQQKVDEEIAHLTQEQIRLAQLRDKAKELR